MKNKILIVILVLVMLVPSVVAIVNYSIQQGGEADSHNTIKLSMTDAAGNTYEFDRKNGKDIMAYFIDAPSNSVSIGLLPSTVESGDFYQITLYTAVKEFGYKYYFTLSGDDCYFVDGDGAAYKINADYAEKFLDKKYAASLYEGGTAPVLTVSGNKCVPDKCAWSFKIADGSFVDADTAPVVKDEAEDLELEGGIAMNFDVEPDSFTVKISDEGGKVIFDDDYANISSMNVTESMSVKIEAAAKWYEDAARDYYGEQSFVFNAELSAPAHFYAGANQVQIGEFICVTGENVGNADNITFTSEPDIKYSPVFYETDGKVQALIPFNWDLSAGEYTLTFAYGGTSQQIKVTLDNRTNAFRDAAVSVPNAAVKSFGTDEVRQKCEDALGEIAKAGDAAMYWDGSFLTGVKDGIIVSGFGHNCKVTGTSVSYRHTGVDYRAAEGSDIQAVNNGKVVYAGYLDYSGYTVVIEHGLGLKSWYAHMGKVSVEVGAEVKKGDTVGTAGASGFISGNGAHVGLTVFDVPVCQYALWDDGSRKGIPVYGK